MLPSWHVFFVVEEFSFKEAGDAFNHFSVNTCCFRPIVCGDRELSWLVYFNQFCLLRIVRSFKVVHNSEVRAACLFEKTWNILNCWIVHLKPWIFRSLIILWEEGFLHFLLAISPLITAPEFGRSFYLRLKLTVAIIRWILEHLSDFCAVLEIDVWDLAFFGEFLNPHVCLLSRGASHPLFIEIMLTAGNARLVINNGEALTFFNFAAQILAGTCLFDNKKLGMVILLWEAQPA